VKHPSRARWRLLAVLCVFSLFAAACGDDDETGGDDPTDEGTDEGTDSTPSTQAAEDVAEGGELVIGAEQEPDCTDWIASCGGSSWGYWMMNVTTLPRAFDVVRDGEEWVYAPTDLLTEEPELDTSGDKPVVTYNINPDAVWSDGEPITSSDFAYTWDQIANGEDIYDKTGYSQIESVDDSDPAVAVVTYSEPFAPWKGLFGGGYGILPSHILEGQDRAAMMADGYDFSGGPWVIDKWEKGVEAVLVPNENYWGDAPKLEKVTFRFVPDTSAEFSAFSAGEVSAIYPQPQPDVVDQIESGLPDGVNSVYSPDTGNLEALWMNNQAPPLDSKAVRQAIAYAINRPEVVEALFGPLGVEEPSQSVNPPILSAYSDDPFSVYEQDLDKVAELLEGDGYAKNGDFYEKDGERLSITVKTTEGNARRELTLEVVQQQLQEVGIEMSIETMQAGDLFGEVLPAGDYQVALYAQVLTTLDPNLCTLFCSKNIPGPENENSGQNWQRVDLTDIDADLELTDVSLDDEERQEAAKRAEQVLADEMVSLPLDPLPNILLWGEDVVGPIADNPVMGPFYNIHQWGLAS
jgi:peptide/nickel transport system substrate-binding protein